MAKFVIECPHCGRFAEAKTGLFARRKLKCTCGEEIDIKTEKMATRVCPECGNLVVFDISKKNKVRCPVCRNQVRAIDDNSKMVEFSCEQCGIRLTTVKSADTYTCPVCDHENHVAERLKMEQITHDGLASIIKYEGDADTLIWKHPIEDFNLGSQLIVHESQEAIFFRDGQALDLFGAGRYTLETQQLPMLEKLYQLPTDTEGTFHSEVYYINLTHQLAVKWGTADKVNLIDPLTQAPISIGARGLLNFRVANARKLLLKLVGTGGKLTRQDLLDNGEGNIQKYFRSVVQLAVSTNLANIITDEKLDILQLDQQKIRISNAMLPEVQHYFDEYGLVITDFLVMGISLPQKGELGYDSLQKILEMRQKTLTKTAIETETELKLAEMDAKQQLDIRLQQNMAAVEAAHREVIAQKGETAVLEAQLEGQRKVAAATGDVAAERMRMQLEMERKAQIAQIEAEEMRLKGYSQRDVLQADVQKSYAEALGQIGANGGGAGGGMMGGMGEIASLGVTLGAMGSVIGMTKDAMAPMMTGAAQMGQAIGNTPAAPEVSTGWDCPECGQRNIQSKFCPECGAKKPEPKPAADSWTCPECGEKGITSKFCPNCGCKKPEPPAAWDCPNCGNKGITAKFCGECGFKKPEAPATWDCPECGNKGITAKFCPECGHKKP